MYTAPKETHKEQNIIALIAQNIIYGFSYTKYRHGSSHKATLDLSQSL